MRARLDRATHPDSIFIVCIVVRDVLSTVVEELRLNDSRDSRGIPQVRTYKRGAVRRGVKSWVRRVTSGNAPVVMVGSCSLVPGLTKVLQTKVGAIGVWVCSSCSG